MSRSGYSEDYEYINLYRNTVDRSIKGKRGQKFLQELASALDAMPEKRLIAEELIDEKGEVCAIGVVCKARGLDVSKVDVTDPGQVGNLVGISRAMAAEIAFENDDEYGSETPVESWVKMRKWVGGRLRPVN